MKLYALCAAALIGCGGPQRLPGTPESSALVQFQNGIQPGLVTYTVDDNTVRVVLTDAGEVSIGQCTNAFGNALMAMCGKVADAKFSDSSPTTNREALKSKLLNKGIFSQYSSSRSTEGSSNATTLGNSVKGNSDSQRYQVVYEWSRYATATLPPSSNPVGSPMVASADYGFAVRLILDVLIQNTEATAQLNLGPAQLDAALALGVAEVSIRYQVLGSTEAMLPNTAYAVRSYDEVKQALEEFHKAAKDLGDAWKNNCLGSDGELTIAAQQKCPVTPVMLAYYAKGPDIGVNHSEREELQRECSQARSLLVELRAKQAAAEGAELSDSDWDRYWFANEEVKRCESRSKSLSQRNLDVLKAVFKDGTPSVAPQPPPAPEKGKEGTNPSPQN